MQDPTSYELKPGDGVTDTFPFSFPYLQTIDIEVSVDGIEQQVGTDFSFIGPNSIQFASVPATGVVILIRRNSIKNGSIADFSRGSLTEEDLDLNRLQAFYAAEEALDQARDTISISPVSGQYDVDGLRVVNASPGIADTDLATIGQLAPFASAAQSAQVVAESARDTAQLAAASSSASEAVVTAAASIVATQFDTFDDRYLGVKLDAPTTDNDGDPLTSGALYFNFTNSTMFVWKGTTWSMLAAAGHNHEDLYYHRPMFHGREEFASGVQSGSTVAGLNLRDPNTIIKNDIAGAYKALVGIGLPAGRYYTEASACTVYPGRTRLGLGSLQLGIDLSSHMGLSEFGHPTGNNTPTVSMSGEFVLPSNDLITLEQRIQTAAPGNGRGVSSNVVDFPEAYSDIKIWRLE